MEVFLLHSIHIPHPTRSQFLRGAVATLGIALVFLVLFATVFQSPLHPLHRITQLRLIRSFVFLLGATLLAQNVSLFQGCPKGRRYSLTCTLLWLLPYLFVFSRIPDYFQNDIGNYYIFPSVFFLTTCLCQRLLPLAGKAAGVLQFVYTVLVFLLLASAYVFLFYFLHYGKPLDEIILMSILATTPLEAYNYLTSVFSLPVLLLLAAALVLAFEFLFRTFRNTCLPPAGSFRHNRRWWVLTLALLFFFVNYAASVFPLDRVAHLYARGGPLRAFTELHRNLPRNARTLKLENTENLASRKVPGTILLVLGESADRDKMSAFAPTPVDTTPWEARMKQDPDFYFYPNAYSNFPNTVMAVTQALTSANQYNRKPLKYAVDLMTLAKKAGYETYWISTQEKSSVSDAGITVIDQQADHIEWLKGDDDVLLPALAQVPAGRNNFVVLHITGSHFRYDQRIPDAYVEKQHWSQLSKDEKAIWYNRSLHFTDSILKKIFETGRSQLHLQAMVYVSDHGEDLQLTHTASPFKFNMVRIPLWIYLSPAYQQAYPRTAATLRRHQQAVFTNDLLFDTMAGLLQAPSNFYDARYDLTREEYAITRENALTLHGKKHIAEDR